MSYIPCKSVPVACGRPTGNIALCHVLHPGCICVYDMMSIRICTQYYIILYNVRIERICIVYVYYITIDYIESLDYVYLYINIYIIIIIYILKYSMQMYTIKNKVIENPSAFLTSNFNSFQAWQRFGSPQRHCGQ